jgi:hypothetical protein
MSFITTRHSIDTRVPPPNTGDKEVLKLSGMPSGDGFCCIEIDPSSELDTAVVTASGRDYVVSVGAPAYGHFEPPYSVQLYARPITRDGSANLNLSANNLCQDPPYVALRWHKTNPGTACTKRAILKRGALVSEVGAGVDWDLDDTTWLPIIGVPMAGRARCRVTVNKALATDSANVRIAAFALSYAARPVTTQPGLASIVQPASGIGGSGNTASYSCRRLALADAVGGTVAYQLAWPTGDDNDAKLYRTGPSSTPGTDGEDDTIAITVQDEPCDYLIFAVKLTTGTATSATWSFLSLAIAEDR